MLPIALLDPATPQSSSTSPFQSTPSAFGTSSTSGTSGSSSTSSTDSGNQLTGNDFITLLAAQLQAQDPLNPIDPTTFVTQLVQFNQLQQLIDINQTLSPLSANASDTTVQPNHSPAAASQANPAASAGL
jgi:flagellar basal-body rod modification protein FlgD